MIKFGNTFVNFGGAYLTGFRINYNPLNLPDNTIRCKFTSGYTPNMGDTQTLVDSINNVWDIYKQSVIWYNLFEECVDLLEVLGANSTNIMDMRSMFRSCESLTSVALFDTSNVTDMTMMFSRCYSLTTIPLFDTSIVTGMGSMFKSCISLTTIPLLNTSNVTKMNFMFDGCRELTSIPLFDTTKVTDMTDMFFNCINVQSGALALYNQASSQAYPPTGHDKTFYDCGINTQTGAAELAQIPADWK